MRYIDTSEKSEKSEKTFGEFDRDIVEEINDFTFVELYDNMHDLQNWSTKNTDPLAIFQMLRNQLFSIQELHSF